MNFTFASLVSLCALFVMVPSTGQAAPFTNGSFELPGGPPPDTFVFLPPDDTSLVGWSIGGSGGPIGYLTDGSWLGTPGPFDAVDGAHQVSFNTGDMPTGNFISQSFDTAIGQQYAVTFFVGRLGFLREDANVSLTASILSSTDEPLASLQVRPPGLGYAGSDSLFFTATSASTTLRFTDTSLETRAVDVLLDGVEVTPVPEPSMFAMAALGVLGVTAVVFARRRTRRLGWLSPSRRLATSDGYP